MFWQHWPLWPLVCSCSIHALLLAFPVALVPGANSSGMGAAARLEVRLSSRSFEGGPAQEVVSVPDQSAVLPPDSAPPVVAPSPMPAQPSIALLVPDRYFASSEVDRKAEPIEIAPLIYPEEAYLRRLHGKVTLRLFINETGSIDSIDILAADPPGMFDQAAIDAVLATRFRPALLLARPVKNVKTIEIRFDPLLDR